MKFELQSDLVKIMPAISEPHRRIAKIRKALRPRKSSSRIEVVDGYPPNAGWNSIETSAQMTTIEKTKLAF